MRCEPLASVEDMLAPEALTALLETPISDVHHASFKSADSLSGGHFLAIQTNRGEGPSLVLKRLSYDSDWLMRATQDRQGRAVLAWETGLLERLPPAIVHGYLACTRDESGWAILMHDLSAFLIPTGESRISAVENECFLDGMASLHVAFWEEPEAVDPALGFSRLEFDYTCLTPETGQREAGGSDPVPQMLIEGWDVLLDTVPPVVAEALIALTRDPAPLCEALRVFSQTLVHSDWKLGNLGLMPAGREQNHTQAAPRVVLLDYDRILAAPPVVDLAWYLAVNSVRLPGSKEETISQYRGCLESRLGFRFDERMWQAQLDLGLLGGFLQLGWSKALGAVRGSSEAVRMRETAELAWWMENVLSGIERL